MRPSLRLPVLSPDAGSYRPSPQRVPARPFLLPALEAVYCDPVVARRVGAAIRLEFLRRQGIPLGEPWRAVLAEVEAWIGFGRDPSRPCRHSAEDALEAAGWW